MLGSNPCISQQQTLSFYITQSSLPTATTLARHSFTQCIRVIANAKCDMKTELITRNKANFAYQFDLASDIIGCKHSHLHGYNPLSDKIEREDLIEHKIRAMNESKARRDIFTLLKFDIKSFINPSSMKISAFTRVDITSNGIISSLTTKA
jgi:NADH/NAD ratio-sensing transcriptional regulator Rex